jgi:hypothetical protein
MELCWGPSKGVNWHNPTYVDYTKAMRRAEEEEEDEREGKE